MIFPGEFNIGEKEGGKVNLPFMEEGRIDATFMVAYIPQGKRDEASLQAATAYAIERLNQVKRQQTLHPDRLPPKRSGRLRRKGKSDLPRHRERVRFREAGRKPTNVQGDGSFLYHLMP